MKSFNLKGFFLIAAALIAMTATAQIPDRKAKDSAVNSTTRYATWNSLPSNTVGFTMTGIKAASGGGTVSGYAILQVAADTLPTVATREFEDYVHPATGRRDTLFFTDIATAQTHTFQAPFPLMINAARIKVVTSGTQKIYLYAVRWRR